MLRRRQGFIARVLLGGALALAAGAAPAAGSGMDPELRQALSRAAAERPLLAIAVPDNTRPVRAVASSLRALGAGTRAFPRIGSLAVLGTPRQLRAAASLPGIRRLYADRELDLLLDDAVKTVRADAAAANFGVTGKGVGIAILDSGIDATHPDLRLGSKTVQNVKVVPSRRDVEMELQPFFEFEEGGSEVGLYAENVPVTDTSSGHGTHVASIAAGTGEASAGRYAGLAPGASLVGLGAGETVTIFGVLAGFEWILANRKAYNIRVVNNSWGTVGPASSYDAEHPINLATRRLEKARIAVVFAAGNGPLVPEIPGTGLGDPNHDIMNLYSLAPWVISVAAGCKEDGDPFRSAICPDGDLTSFSSRGNPTHPLARPALTAPGFDVLAARATAGAVMHANDAFFDAFACDPGEPELKAHYTCGSGTSMAAPVVAGAVALMLERNPKLKPRAIKDILVSTARPMLRTDGEPYAEWEAGAGMLDVLGAVHEAR